jgi:hypothetical protein
MGKGVYVIPRGVLLMWCPFCRWPWDRVVVHSDFKTHCCGVKIAVPNNDFLLPEGIEPQGVWT